MQIRHRRSTRSLLVLLITLLIAGACTREQSPPDRLLEGARFPEVILQTLDDDHVALTEFRGKVVVLNVWATWCHACRKELPSLDRLREQLDSQRSAVIAMSVDDDPYQVREYLLERAVRLTSYIDHNMKIANGVLGISVYPDTFVIDPEGNMVRRFVGEQVWDAPQMIKALQALSQGDRHLLAVL